MPQEMPGAQFEDLTGAGLPNIFSAGTSPDLQSPSPSWPYAGVIPELNTRWINPGMYLDTGTEFGQNVGSAPKGTAALPNFSFPGFPNLFNFPGFVGTMGAGQPPTQQAGSKGPSVGSLIGTAGSTLSKLLKSTTEDKSWRGPLGERDLFDMDEAIRHLRDYRAFAPDSLQANIDQFYGTKPEYIAPFDLTGSGTATPPFDLGINQRQLLSDLIVSDRPLGFSGAFAPGADEAPILQAGFGPGQYSLNGVNPMELNYSLSPSAAGSVGGLPGALGGATPYGLGLGSVLMAVGSQIPGEAGQDLKTAGAALMGVTGAASLGATALAGGATVAADAAALGGLSGVAGAAAPVFAIPAAIAAIYGSYGPWGHGVNFPPGYVQFIGPDGGSWAVDPRTGAVLQGIDRTRGRGTFKPSENTLKGIPATPEDFIKWGIPSDLYPQTKPSDVYKQITGGTYDPTNISTQPAGMGGIEDHYAGPTWSTPVFADPNVSDKTAQYFDPNLYNQWLATQTAPSFNETSGGS